MLSNPPDDELFYMHTVHLSVNIDLKEGEKICHRALKKSQKWLSIEIAAPCNYFLCTLLNPEIDVVKIAVENVFEFAGIYSKLLKYVNSGPLILWSQCYDQLYSSLYNYVRYTTKFELKIWMRMYTISGELKLYLALNDWRVVRVNQVEKLVLYFCKFWIFIKS